MFSFSTIAAFHQDLIDNKFTCQDAVNYYLQKIESTKSLNAFTDVFAEEAIAKAQELDLKMKSGVAMKQLHGVVIAIKDVICYENHQVSAASKMLSNFRSTFTASALQALIDEDAIIIGNCNCDEFAMGSSNEHSAYGSVKNFLDETKVPGGSSGGSAVAVQADCCMISLGSDTGGSVRQPAAFCGIVGLKPSYGRISRFGLIAYASSFDQIGIFGKNIDDVALVLDIMSHPDKKDSTMLQSFPKPVSINLNSQEKFKFCYFKETIDHDGLDAEIRDSFKKYIEELKQKGHQVTELSFSLLPYIVPTYYVLTTAEASSNLSRYDGVRFGHSSTKKTENIAEMYKNNRSEGFGFEVKKRIMLGNFVLSTGYYDAYFAKAQQIRRLMVNQVNEIFKENQAILMPVTPSTAYNIGDKNLNAMQLYIGDIYTVFANLTGLPAISLPLFSHSNNMPFGLQVLTNKEDELTLLQISKQLM